MPDAIDVFLDISKPQGALVRSLTDASPPTFGPFYQGALLKLRVYPVVPTGASIGTLFSKVSLSTLDLQVVVGPAAGAESIKAAQYTWSKQQVADSDGLSGYFYADLDLNTTDLNNAISTNATYSTIMEFLLSRDAGAYSPVYQVDIQVKAIVKGPSGAASIPTPAVEYLTRAQAMELFVLWNNTVRAANNGRSIITVSPDGSHTREFGGVDNDGAPTDNLT